MRSAPQCGRLALKQTQFNGSRRFRGNRGPSRKPEGYRRGRKHSGGGGPSGRWELTRNRPAQSYFCAQRRPATIHGQPSRSTGGMSKVSEIDFVPGETPADLVLRISTEFHIYRISRGHWEESVERERFRARSR